MDSAATKPMPTPIADAAIGPDDLRLVLFGMPAAGKSSLLGALGEAALDQEHLLGGKLADKSEGLRRMRRQLYETSGQRTPEEVMPYPVRYQPAGGKAVDAVIMDCDGRVASDLLAAKGSTEGTLAREVADADALLLVTDASAPPAQLDKDFGEFDRFLSEMEESRGERTEVGGMPVYLVLTKCDLLAHPNDSATDWMECLERKKADADAKFRAFLAKRQAGSTEAAPSPGFGRIDIRVWATAVKRPALLGTAAKPREPYGVAELFRQALQGAAAYRASADRSGQKLAWLVGIAAVVLLGGIGLAIGMLLLAKGAEANSLLARAEELKFNDKDTPAQRLRGSIDEARRRLEKIDAVRQDKAFDSLPAVLREWLIERHSELKRYVSYFDKVLAERSPAAERTEEGLEKQIGRLQNDLDLPEPDWDKTPAAARRRELLDTAEAIRRGVQAARNWYLDSSDQAGKVLAFRGYRTEAGIDWAGWAGEADKLLDPARKPPFSANDILPGTAGLTYETALGFDRAVQARSAWLSDRDQVRSALEACVAVGLVPGREGQLVFSRTFSLKSAKERLDALRAVHPAYKRKLLHKALPEAVRPAVAQAARSQYDNLLLSGRGEVLRQLRIADSGSKETLERWQGIRKWLREPGELAEWRELALALLRLERPAPDDPVAALATFLAKGSFTLEARSVIVEIPKVRGIKPQPGQRFKVYHPASMRQPALGFSPSGEPQDGAGGRTRRYTFRLADGVRIIFKPGDTLWAELPLSATKDYLAWADARSRLYQFEKLGNPPRIVPPGAASLSLGRLADGVRLEWVGGDGLPAVPELMPDVRLGD